MKGDIETILKILLAINGPNYKLPVDWQKLELFDLTTEPAMFLKQVGDRFQVPLTTAELSLTIPQFVHHIQTTRQHIHQLRRRLNE